MTTDRFDLAERAAVDAALAEYSTLREEIIFRMRSADYFTVLALAALAAVVGVAGGGSDIAFLAVSYVASISVMLYLNQLRIVHRIGDYISARVEPRIAAYVGSDAMGWEQFVRSARSVWPWRRPVFLNTIFFFVLSGVGLGLSAEDAWHDTLKTVFWLLAILVAFVMGGLWFYVETHAPDPATSTGSVRDH